MESSRQLAEQAPDSFRRYWFSGKCAELAANLGTATELYLKGFKAAENPVDLVDVLPADSMRLDGSERDYWRANFSRKLALLAWQRIDTTAFHEYCAEIRRLLHKDGHLQHLEVDDWILQGHHCESHWRNGAASNCYRRALERAIALNDLRRQVNAQMLLGRALRFLGDEHVAASSENLETAIATAEKIGHRSALIQAKMYHVDLYLNEDPLARQRYLELHDEAERCGFKGIQMRIRERLLRFQLHPLEECANLVADLKAHGYVRLALLYHATALRYNSSNDSERARQSLKQLIGDIRSLGPHQCDTTLVVRDVVQSIARLSNIGVIVHRRPEVLAQGLTKLRLHCTNPVRTTDWQETHDKLVVSIIETLSGDDPGMTASIALERKDLQSSIFSFLQEHVGQRWRVCDLAKSLPEVSSDSVRKCLDRLQESLRESGSHFSLEKTGRGAWLLKRGRR